MDPGAAKLPLVDDEHILRHISRIQRSCNGVVRMYGVMMKVDE